MVTSKSNISRLVRVIPYLLLLSSVAVSASPLLSKAKRQSSSLTEDALEPCGFAGNQDIYGLGIRIGLYAQWLSTYISNWLHNKKLTKMRDINTMFQLAMLVALMSIANQDPKPHVIDPFIIIIQVIGSASTITDKATHKSEWKGTSWGGMIRFFVYWAVSCYAVWFWFLGINKFAELPNATCDPIGFAFSKQPLFAGWFRTANKAVACFFAFIYTILFGYSVWNFGPEYVSNTRTKFSTMHHSVPPQALLEPQSVTERGTAEIREVEAESADRLNKWTPAMCCQEYPEAILQDLVDTATIKS
ncbi:uncharacterized protein H6S33_003512 [Morchella sextelata]|uniref:uncharacterized protein n=1 Tax=Morchella sextelata TaxID=1174677 RepID=UPI001D03F0C0|nr:uncharacterized protein H6S33_003512 [Morchella sextelata]KAH0606678.1 hypothetical protein H6S33_003512 [Morchella sextelata]